ncbi:hypothetical protein BHE74_00008209 [Ensete ventricosum]|nr:hypothetical protein GW17_00026436 [Ensete ventricosum]RWW83283.1 hypothetical protein BHE74_00008209 [Ensete ventricosum]RZS10229.1 hypothetical protein BHM03_00041416 [Ensete ventricosum]
MVMQCLGAICGAGVVKGYQKGLYESNGGGANVVAPGYTKGDGLGAEIVGTFILVYTVFSATDAKRNARDSHVPILAPLPIGFAVFLVHLATIPITGTGINPARSLGAAIIYNKKHAWDDHVSVVSVEPSQASFRFRYCLQIVLFPCLSGSFGLDPSSELLSPPSTTR